MKIVYGSEPLYCDASDTSFNIMTDIGASSSDEDLMEGIRKWLPLPFEAMVSSVYLSHGNKFVCLYADVRCFV